MTPGELKLIEKIIRAKVELEGALRPHSDSCPIDMDPYYMGPCKCGATTSNNRIAAALRELDLTK